MHFPIKNAIPYRKVHFPAENAFSCRKCTSLQKMRFSGGTWQETAGNCLQGSRSRIESGNFEWGVFLSRGCAERIWDEILAWRTVGKSPTNFSANFDGDFFFLQNFRPCFSRASGPHKKIAQNSRPELSAFLSNFTFSSPNFFTPIFCLLGRSSVERGMLAILEQHSKLTSQ